MSKQDILDKIAASTIEVLAVREQYAGVQEAAGMPVIDVNEAVANIAKVNDVVLYNEADYFRGDGLVEDAHTINDESATSTVRLSSITPTMVDTSDGDVYEVPAKALIIIDVVKDKFKFNYPLLGEFGSTVISTDLQVIEYKSELLARFIFDKDTWFNGATATSGVSTPLPTIKVSMFNKITGNVNDPYYMSQTRIPTDLRSHPMFDVTAYKQYAVDPGGVVTTSERTGIKISNSLHAVNVIQESMKPENISSVYGFPLVTPEGVHCDAKTVYGKTVVQKNFAVYPGNTMYVPKSFDVPDFKYTYRSAYPAVLLGRDKVMFDIKSNAKTGLQLKEVKSLPINESALYSYQGSTLFTSNTGLSYRDFEGNSLLEITHEIPSSYPIVQIVHHGYALISHVVPTSGFTQLTLCMLGKDSASIINTSLIQSNVNNLDTFNLGNETCILACTDTGVEQYILTMQGLAIKKDLFISGEHYTKIPNMVKFTGTKDSKGRLEVLYFMTENQNSNLFDIAYSTLDLRIDSLNYNNLISTPNTFKLSNNSTDFDAIGPISPEGISLLRSVDKISILLRNSTTNKDAFILIPTAKLEDNFNWNVRVSPNSWGLAIGKEMAFKGGLYLLGLNGTTLTVTISDHWDFGDAIITGLINNVRHFTAANYNSDIIIVAHMVDNTNKFFTIDSSIYKVAFEEIEASVRGSAILNDHNGGAPV